jgi:phosphoglucosamine mutase
MDNGVKFFSSTGAKIEDAQERAIESYVLSPPLVHRPVGEAIGRVLDGEHIRERYPDFLVSCVQCAAFRPFRVGLDCANGAASSVAPRLFRQVGLTTYVWNVTPDGLNINQGCGAVYPEFLQAKVLSEALDVGFAFDGDADRLMVIDNAGNILDGDHILAICARYGKDYDAATQKVVVGTVMSNLGLERVLKQIGFVFHATQVGDKHVLRAMRQYGAILGGEPSGHIIFSKHHCTGDGLLTAIEFLNIMAATGLSASQLGQTMRKFPQSLVNVRLNERREPLSSLQVQATIEWAEQMLGDEGRVVVRLSGTELAARVMVEGPEESLVAGLADRIARSIAKAFDVSYL